MPQTFESFISWTIALSLSSARQTLLNFNRGYAFDAGARRCVEAYEGTVAAPTC
jgi:hypothetical protein